MTTRLLDFSVDDADSARDRLEGALVGWGLADRPGPNSREDLAHLDALLTLLRRHGVRRYKDVELVPFVALPPPPEVATPAPEKPDLTKPDVVEQVERDLFPAGLGG